MTILDEDRIRPFGASKGALLLTISQAGQALNLGRTKLYQLINNGDLEVVKIGRATRVTSRSVQALPDKLSGGRRDSR